MADIKIEVWDDEGVEENVHENVRSVAGLFSKGASSYRARQSKLTSRFVKYYIEDELEYYEKIGFDLNQDFDINDVSNYLLLADKFGLNPLCYQKVIRELLSALACAKIDAMEVIDDYIEERGTYSDRNKRDLLDALKELKDAMPEGLLDALKSGAGMVELKINARELSEDFQGVLDGLVEDAVKGFKEFKPDATEEDIEHLKAAFIKKITPNLEKERDEYLKHVAKKEGDSSVKH